MSIAIAKTPWIGGRTFDLVWFFGGALVAILAFGVAALFRPSIVAVAWIRGAALRRAAHDGALHADPSRPRGVAHAAITSRRIARRVSRRSALSRTVDRDARRSRIFSCIFAGSRRSTATTTSFGSTAGLRRALSRAERRAAVVARGLLDRQGRSLYLGLFIPWPHFSRRASDRGAIVRRHGGTAERDRSGVSERRSSPRGSSSSRVTSRSGFADASD